MATTYLRHKEDVLGSDGARLVAWAPDVAARDGPKPSKCAEKRRLARRIRSLNMTDKRGDHRERAVALQGGAGRAAEAQSKAQPVDRTEQPSVLTAPIGMAQNAR